MTDGWDPLGDRPVPVVLSPERLVTRGARSALDGPELLAAFAATLARYMETTEVVVGWGDGAWRTVRLRVDLDRPLGALVEAAREVLDASPVPALEVALCGVAPHELPDGEGPALLTFEAATGRIEAAAGLYTADRVQRFVEHVARLAVGLSRDDPIGGLPLVSDAERDALAHRTAGVVEESTIVDLLLQRVEADPAAVAVRAAGASLTYAELWDRSGALASRLPSGELVGVWADRTVDLLVALVGVLRAGSAYVALEPGYPLARLRLTTDLARLSAVVARDDIDARERALLTALELPVVGTSGRVQSARPAPPAAADLAYVMFTSGSTGVPKGVMVEHRNVVNTLRHMATDPGLEPGEVMLGVTTASFDLSVPDLFLPLVTGATLVLADVDSQRDAQALARLIAEHRPRLMQATPSTWRLLLAGGWSGAPWMRVVCGGEGYDAALAQALGERVAGVWNFYGPTETTVWSVATRLTGLETDPLPLGSPMRGVACYLLDSRQQPCPPGVRGEIAIAGAGLARGYLDRPDLTEAAFVTCPFPGAPSDRMYLTGDLGRFTSNGALVFAGRRDHQVKLNGYRIELGEVEAALKSLTGVRQAVAVVSEDEVVPRLLAYVVVDPDAASPSPDSLRSRCAALLPPQSVPSVVIPLADLPLTPNGKIDRAALTAPAVRVGVPLDGELEELVALVCTRVLHRPVRYSDDDVFALGADSLLVGRISVRLTSDLGVDVPPALVFRNPTVRGLARALLEVLAGDAPEVVDDILVAASREGGP